MSVEARLFELANTGNAANPATEERRPSSRSRSSANMGSSNPRRVHLSRDRIADLDKEQLVAKWYQQDAYINKLEASHDLLIKQTEHLQNELERNVARNDKRLHNICMKLRLKETRIAHLQEKLDVITQSQSPTSSQLENTLVDPAVNFMFEKMKSELEQTRDRVVELQEDITAWKFTSDSTTGKLLMARCRLLHKENEELGKELSNGWVAQLTGNLALQKKFSEEMKKSQTELDEFLLELEEEVEGMQNTIYYLQKQLKEAKEQRTLTEVKSDVKQTDTSTSVKIESS